VKSSLWIRQAAILLLVLTVLSGCQRKLGWGVVLWAQENAKLPSGAIVPVFVRSNIEKKWIIGIPKQYRNAELKTDKIEIPLPQLHLSHSKWAAKRWAAKTLGEYTYAYAENLQDGLPIRSNPENGAQRVYRLRAGEIIKIMQLAEGVPAIGATGEPLPGKWFSVLTENGTKGYCFSYRLRIFDYSFGGLGGSAASSSEEDSGDATDMALDSIISKKWLAVEYWEMINENKLVIEDLEKQWGFSFGEDIGIANIYVPDMDKSFHYTSIKNDGYLKWRFEGTPLRFEQTAENQIKVQFSEEIDVYSENAPLKTFFFYTLPMRLETIIAEEEERRKSIYKNIYAKGPIFSSSDFGKIYLTENRDFVWDDFQALVPTVIPISAMSSGKIDFGYFLSDELSQSFDGVITLKFNVINGPMRETNFLYRFDDDVLILRHIPRSDMQERTVIKLTEEAAIITFNESN
jgi:hypothetical protein